MTTKDTLLATCALMSIDVNITPMSVMITCPEGFEFCSDEGDKRLVKNSRIVSFMPAGKALAFARALSIVRQGIQSLNTKEAIEVMKWRRS